MGWSRVQTGERKPAPREIASPGPALPPSLREIYTSRQIENQRSARLNKISFKFIVTPGIYRDTRPRHATPRHATPCRLSAHVISTLSRLRLHCKRERVYHRISAPHFPLSVHPSSPSPSPSRATRSRILREFYSRPGWTSICLQ